MLPARLGWCHTEEGGPGHGRGGVGARRSVGQAPRRQASTAPLAGTPSIPLAPRLGFRSCLPEWFMVSARTPGDSLPTAPLPQFRCPSHPLSHQPPHPTPSRPGNPAGAELRPAAHSDPITAATVRLSLEAAPGSLARVSTAGLQPASPLPGVGRFPKGSGFSPCSVNMSGRESWEVWALHTAHTCPCNTRAPTQTHILHIHVYTHTRAHSRTEKHTCKRVHGPSWPGQCWGNAGLAVYGTNP